jgi:hypothetical protein
MATSSAAVKPAENAEIARLQAENAELEREVERLEHALHGIEVHVMQGYAVAVYPIDDGFLGTCPKLHASVHEATREETLRSLGEAMEVAREGHAYFGNPLPPRDAQ